MIDQIKSIWNDVHQWTLTQLPGSGQIRAAFHAQIVIFYENNPRRGYAGRSECELEIMKPIARFPRERQLRYSPVRALSPR